MIWAARSCITNSHSFEWVMDWKSLHGPLKKGLQVKVRATNTSYPYIHANTHTHLHKHIHTHTHKLYKKCMLDLKYILYFVSLSHKHTSNSADKPITIRWAQKSLIYLYFCQHIYVNIHNEFVIKHKTCSEVSDKFMLGLSLLFAIYVLFLI